MTFFEAMRAFINKRLDFSTRSRRSEYWWVQLVCLLFIISTLTLDELLFGGLERFAWDPISTAFELVILVPIAALTARRFHDVGITGWAQLPSFLFWLEEIPQFEGILFGGIESGEPARIILTVAFIIYNLWFLYYMIKDGDPGRNRYGENPKMPSLEDIFD